MKETKTKFTCDCGCKKVVTIKEGDGYPYDKGWIYIYRLDLKATKIDSRNVPIIDKHFAGYDCVSRFVKTECMARRLAYESTKKRVVKQR